MSCQCALRDAQVTTVFQAIYSRIITHEHRFDSDGTHYGILKGVVEHKAFRKGTWGAAIAEVMTPEQNDIVIEGKRGLDAFPSTNLDFILRSRGIRTVVLGGFLANCCVESTMRSAYERGFEVITLTDCTATVSLEAQQMALAHDFGMFSHPMTHATFLETLG